MTETQASELFPMAEMPASNFFRSTGLWPSRLARAAMNRGHEIQSAVRSGDDQIQPSSLDLRLGEVAYRVRASFLPGPAASVHDKLERLSMHQIDLTQGAVLEKDCVYIVPLLEHLALKKRVSALANPKSSIGRLDVFARVITDQGTEFDRIREGYRGPLYAEISPRSFSVLARTGSRLVQLRIRRGSPIFRDTALRRLHAEVGLVDTPADGSPNAETIRNGLAFTVDVSGEAADGIIGWKARRHTGVIDVDRIDYYDPLDFFEPVRVPRVGKGMQGVVLDPNDFYILATREAVVVAPDHAAEMVPYGALCAQFRGASAGFVG